MNFIQLNNNIETNEVIINSSCQDKVKMNTPSLVTVFDNCNMKFDGQPVITNIGNSYSFDDEYPFVEKFDLNEDEKNVKKVDIASKENERDIKKGTILKDAVVILEKLPDDKVQHYLAKEAKNYDIMNFGQKVPSSNALRSIRKKKNISNPTPGRNFVKKIKFEADDCMKGILSPAMQQYLANTEMGYSCSDFTELVAEPQKYTTRVNECTTDNLITNLCDTDEIQHPVQIKRKHQNGDSLQQHFVDMKENRGTDNYLNNHIRKQGNIDFSCPKGQESFIDVEKIDDFLQNSENLPVVRKSIERKKIRRKKGGVKRKKNLTSTMCQRICPNCKTYKLQNGKASKKVMCLECKILTLYECRKCKKQISNYSTMYHHLLHQCEACMLYMCAHCKYFVRKKRLLLTHLNKEHKRIFFNDLVGQSKNKNAHRSSHPSRQYENLIILKKQKEMKSNSEWYIDNKKRDEANVGKESSVLKTSKLALPSLKLISSLPVQNSTSTIPVSNPTSVKAMCYFYCQYCETEMDVYGPYSHSEIYCDNCGLTVLIFKCSKCCKTCETYGDMKQHLKKDCTLSYQKKVRENFYCSECNYRSCFQGLVENHYSKIHGLDRLQTFSADNSIQDFQENDFYFHLRE